MIRNMKKQWKKIKQGGERGWRWEKACNAGGFLLFEANTVRMFVINCQNSQITQMHEWADLVEIIGGLHNE